MELRIDVPNAQAISAAFLQAPDIVMEELLVSMGRATDNLWQLTEQHTPKVTSHLANNWITDESVVGATVIGTVSNIVSYAIPVELGVKKHERTYKERVYLHPGFEGRRMAHKALEEARPAIEDEFTKCAGRIADRIAAAGRAASAGGAS